VNGAVQSSDLLRLVECIAGHLQPTNDNHVLIHLSQLIPRNIHLQTQRVQVVRFKCLGGQVDREMLIGGLWDLGRVCVARGRIRCYKAL